jgi:hypothetical protein
MTIFKLRLVGSMFACGLVAGGCGDDGRDFETPGAENDGGGGVEAPDAAFGGETSGSDAGLATTSDGVLTVSIGASSAQQESGDSTGDSGRSGEASELSTSGETSTSGSDASGSEISGGDTNGSDTGGGDTGGADTDGTDVDTTEEVVSVSVVAEGDLVGYPVFATASGESSRGSNVSYQWEIVSKPSGSSVVDGDLVVVENHVTFQPDRAGDYVLRVTAQSELGGEGSTEVTVEGRAYDVGYLNVAGDQDSWTRAGFMVQSDGTNPRQVGCNFSSDASSESEWLGTFKNEGQLGLLPYFPKDGSVPARLAYNYQPAEGEVQLFIASPNNDCGTNPPPTVLGGNFPAFPPSGGRVSIVTTQTEASGDTTVTTYGLRTYDVQGGSPRQVRGGAPQLIYGATWVDDETLVWAEIEASAYRIYRAKDVDGAFENDLLTEIILDCSTATAPIPGVIHHATQRGERLFVSSSNTVILGPGTSAYSVWMLQPGVGGVYDCESGAATNLKLTDDNAHDYDVSTDGSKLLYLATVSATETETSATHLWLKDLANDAAPLLLSGEASTTASGAHFAANGRQIVWSETKQVFSTYNESSYERPEQSRVRVANADGANPRTLVTVSSTPTQARMFHTGGNAFCGVSIPGRPGIAGGGALLLLLGFAIRRRGQGKRGVAA